MAAGHSRRMRIGAGLVAVAIVATGIALLVIRSRADHPAAATPGVPSQSAWQQVMAGATDTGETTATMARQAFSLTFEALNDVDLPSGSRDDIQSGSAALRMMIAHWDELTTSEQNVVLSYLPSDDPTTTPSGNSIVPIRHFRADRTDGPGPDEATKRLIEGRVAALRTSLGAQAGGFLTGTVELSYNTHDVEIGSAAYTLPHAVGQLVVHPTPTTATLAGTRGNYFGCFIALNRFGWSLTGTDLDFVLAHELYHCFEGMFIGDLNMFYDKATAPSWVIEGGANWAAAQVVPTSTYPAGAWHDYLLVPSTPLFKQGYEAIGFWNHLREISPIDTWGALRSALGKSSPEALARTDAGTDAFLDSWASSLFRQPQYGPSWHTDGPTMGPLRFTPEEVTIDAGSRVSRRALPHAKTLLTAAVATDIIVIVSVGHVTLHNPAHDDANFGQLVYCAREEGCACPPGSANTAPSPAALGGRGVALGVTGSDRAAAVALGGISLDEWCRKSNPPISKRPSTPAGNGSSDASGTGSLCHQIVERLGIDGLLGHPSLSPADIEACVKEILASGGFGVDPED